MVKHLAECTGQRSFLSKVTVRKLRHTQQSDRTTQTTTELSVVKRDKLINVTSRSLGIAVIPHHASSGERLCNGTMSVCLSICLSVCLSALSIDSCSCFDAKRSSGQRQRCGPRRIDEYLLAQYHYRRAAG